MTELVPTTRTLIFTALVTMLGCGEGPMGPAGPQGEPGPGTRLVLIPTVSGGGAVSELPIAIGGPQNPPALSCFIGDGSGAWIALADGFSATSTVCGLAYGNGRWNAIAARVPPGFQIMFVIVY